MIKIEASKMGPLELKSVIDDEKFRSFFDIQGCGSYFENFSAKKLFLSFLRPKNPSLND